MCGLQSLPCWHSSCLQCVILVDRIPGRSTWGPPTIYVHPWTAVGGEGREGLLSVPDRLPVVSIVLACPPDGSISSRPDIDVFMAGRDIVIFLPHYLNACTNHGRVSRHGNVPFHSYYLPSTITNAVAQESFPGGSISHRSIPLRTVIS
jgi:hypothetical protein